MNRDNFVTRNPFLVAVVVAVVSLLVTASERMSSILWLLFAVGMGAVAWKGIDFSRANRHH